MVQQRLTRVERKERTRDGLVRAARRVFLRQGFHAASLEEIVEEAGFTKGAVYSNFESKDDLFLAVLEDHYEQQARRYAEIVLDGDTPEETYRAVARLFIAGTLEREPAWIPLSSEFMTHASRRPRLARAVAAVRERFLDSIATLIEGMAARHGVEYRLSSREVALGSSAVMRGLAVERTIRPHSVPPELFEEIHTAYMRGVTRGPDGRGGS